jgi:hypothetical protein
MRRTFGLSDMGCQLARSDTTMNNQSAARLQVQDMILTQTPNKQIKLQGVSMRRILSVLKKPPNPASLLLVKSCIISHRRSFELSVFYSSALASGLLTLALVPYPSPSATASISPCPASLHLSTPLRSTQLRLYHRSTQLMLYHRPSRAKMLKSRSRVCRLHV